MNMFNRFTKIRFAHFYHRAALCMAALLFCFSLPSYADPIQDAHKLFKQGQHGQALDKVNTFLASKPKDAQARFLKGLILTEQGKSADAIKIFTALTEDYPELPEPYNNLAVLYASQGQYDKAKLSLEMAIRTHPSYATAHENLGDIYAKMASQAYDRALQLDRSNAATQTKLSMIQDLFAGGARGKTSRTALGKVDAPVTSKVEAPALSKAEVVAPTLEVASKPASVKTEPLVRTEPVKSEVAAAAATKPAGKNAEPAKNSSDEVLKTINAWAAAWSAKDVKKYLSFYAADFKAPDNATRAAWEAMREERVKKPKSIKVGISGAKVDFIDSDHATVKFHQSYHASHLKISGDKTLLLVKSGAGWLIQEESAK